MLEIVNGGGEGDCFWKGLGKVVELCFRCYLMCWQIIWKSFYKLCWMEAFLVKILILIFMLTRSSSEAIVGAGEKNFQPVNFLIFIKALSLSATISGETSILFPEINFLKLLDGQKANSFWSVIVHIRYFSSGLNITNWSFENLKTELTPFSTR